MILLSVILYLSYHYTENPIVIGVLIGITVLFFLMYGTEYISVYEDRFEVKTDSLVHLFNKRNVYHYKDIREITGEPRSTTQEIVAYAVFRIFLRQRDGHMHILYVTDRNGSTKKLLLSIHLADLEKATIVIREQLKNYKAIIGANKKS